MIKCSPWTGELSVLSLPKLMIMVPIYQKERPKKPTGTVRMEQVQHIRMRMGCGMWMRDGIKAINTNMFQSMRCMKCPDSITAANITQHSQEQLLPSDAWQNEKWIPSIWSFINGRVQRKVLLLSRVMEMLVSHKPASITGKILRFAMKWINNLHLVYQLIRSTIICRKQEQKL